MLIAILFVPIPQGSYDDGGTREYIALTYKIVDWNKLTADGVYEKVRFYGPTDRSTSIDELWLREVETLDKQMVATVVSISGTVSVIESVEDKKQYIIRIDKLEDIGVTEGSVVEITYSGALPDSISPMLTTVKSWKLSKNLSHIAYTDEWLDKETAEKYDNNLFSDIVITEIYSNCFFAETVIPMPDKIKLNGTLTEEWCVGDQILCTYENTYYDKEKNRIEADFLTVTASDWEPEPGVAYKPVVYLYPEQDTEISVKLTLDGELVCTYPQYNNGWTVIASPDGILTDREGQTYNYLYWEGEIHAEYDFTQGFCVKGEDTAAFLEKALETLGLNRREANEFIVYWLPLMQENPYNIISFQGDSYTNEAKLEVVPVPDTMIRVFMAWQSTEDYVEIEAQELASLERSGFTVVEWGGTEVK